MSYEQEQAQRLRDELSQRMNKVPDRVKNGSVQAVREWVGRREEAAKLLKKRGATVTEYISAISRLE